MKVSDELIGRVLVSLPPYYKRFRESLSGYKEAQIAMLYLLDKAGRPTARKELYEQLSIDSKKASELMRPLIEKGLVQTERPSRESVDMITDMGRKELGKILNQVFLFFGQDIGPIAEFLLTIILKQSG